MRIVDEINRNLSMISEARWAIERGEYPTAEEIITEVIKEVEDSDYYKEDVAEGRLFFELKEEKDIYTNYVKDEVKDARFPYSQMYEVKAESLCADSRCVNLLEEAHSWAPANYYITVKLLNAYFDHALYDRALGLSLKTYRFINDEYREAQLFYAIRRIGEGCCWELKDEELESAEDSIAMMDAYRYSNDFKNFGIPCSADGIRELDDLQINKIVDSCFPEKCELADMPDEEVWENEYLCPYCGDDRYYVRRTYCSLQSEPGVELYIEDGGPLVAYCQRCRTPVEVDWVQK